MKKITSGLPLHIYILLLLTQFACTTVQKPVQKTSVPPVVATTNVPVQAEPIAATIGATPIKTEELATEVEILSVSDSLKPDEALKEAVNNLRIVEEAKRLGYDKSENFVGEFKTYRNIEAQRYLTDSTTIKQLLQTTYQWLQEEVNVSHILYQVSEFAEAADTLAIYNKLLDLRTKALAGEDFAELARQNSQDKKTNTQGGNLGWFTALKMLYPIEKAAYTTPVGQISMPFRTKGGLHILKVNARRPASGKLVINHIAKFAPQNSNEIEKIKAKTTIDSVYNRLLAGDDFGLLSAKYSDADNRSQAGLRKVSIGEYEKDFEEVVFALKEGELSKPFLTKDGWHIVKLIRKEPLESFDKIKPELLNKVTTDSRGALVNENALNKLKRQLAFVENEPIVKQVIAVADSNLYRKKWLYPLNDEAVEKTLFSLWKKDFKGKDFYEYVIDRQQVEKIPIGYTPQMAFRSFYKKFVENSVRNYAEEHLEELNKDFRLLMNEYRKSILSMQLLNSEVYEKSVSDTLGQRLFYEKNLSKYVMPERVFATVIISKDEKNIPKVKEIFAKGIPYQLKALYSKALYFDPSSSEINNEHKVTLMGLLEFLRRNKDYLVEIGGYADVLEADSLSGKRLDATKKFLIANGLPLERIIENDYGKTRPIMTDKFESSRTQRVMFQFFSNAKKDVEKVFNKKDGALVTIQEGYFKRGDNKFVDAVTWSVGSHVFTKDGQFSEIAIEKVEPRRFKTLKEARGEVIADYQKQLEIDFKQKLESNYPVKFNSEEVQKILKPLSQK